MDYLKNPCKVFARYIIQKSLGKFLKNKVSLTNEDFGKEVINLTNL